MSSPPSRLPDLFTGATWCLFAGSVMLAIGLGTASTASLGPWILIDGLTVTAALLVTLVSGLVHSFARRYMAGSQRIDRFFTTLFALTVTVLTLTAADHVVLFVGLWAAMGWLLASLIGHVQGWPAARAAGRLARRSFLGGSVALAGAAIILVEQTGAWTLSGIAAATGAVAAGPGTLAVVLIAVAALVQSALVPFHRWLLSSMTAPTPVSAFMHAGLVNAGGLLLARFFPVVTEVPGALGGLVVAGALSALVGQAWLLVQTDIKRQLACSTVAQMGFMILQVGLGFVAAAVTHLILHGFYKATLFLGAGSVVHPSRPPSPGAAASGPSLAAGATALIAAAAGGWGFAALTGKSLTALNSGTLLVFFVVVAVLHAVYTVVRQARLSAATRLWAVPAMLLPTLALYAGAYNGVSALLQTAPAAALPTELSAVHLVTAGVFALAYGAMALGLHRDRPRLYVALLNSSQPASSTLLTRRDQYHAY